MTLSATEVAVPEAVPGAVPAVEDRGDFFEPEPTAAGVRVDAEYNPGILAKLVKEEPAAKVDPEEKPDATIPRARFNEVNEENKALKAQLESLKTAQRPATETTEQAGQQQTVEDPREKIREMRRQQKDLELEGDLEAASVLGDQIDDLLLQVATVRAETNIKQSASQETLQSSLETVATAAYEKYPFLNIDSPDVDVDAVGAVRARTAELITTGLTPVEALQTAVQEKGPKFARLLGTQTPATVDTSKADEVRQSRDIQARTTAASASVAQPPVLPGKGEESFTVNIDKMSEKQFKEFSKTEAAAKARGDIL
jgi:hypothetical protein